MALVAVWGAWRQWRSKALSASRIFLWTVVASGPLGIIAVEAGWIVTEVGRQPWIIQGVMRTADAVTPATGVVAPLLLFAGIYLFLACIVVMLLIRQVESSPHVTEGASD